MPEPHAASCGRQLIFTFAIGTMYLFSKSQYSEILRKACNLARKIVGAEICGLIVDTGCHLSLIRVRNVSKRAGSFAFSRPEVRRIVAASKILDQVIVGTFHSHPVGIATPGKTDIENAVDDSLMLIIDCTSKKGSLWRVRSGKARQVAFELFQAK